jgi:hypothetical protein
VAELRDTLMVGGARFGPLPFNRGHVPSMQFNAQTAKAGDEL